MKQIRYIWLGVRESDIEDTGGLFAGSVTLFGSGKNGNRAMEKQQRRRVDHNGECPFYDVFFQDAMRHILEEMPDARFIQYAPLDGRDFSPELQERLSFQNPYALLAFLEHKLELKAWAGQYAAVLPSQTTVGLPNGRETLRELLPDADAVVVQRDSSCGGMGTFLVRLDTDEALALPVGRQEPCMVTPFQANSISVNVHAVLYEEEILLFPPSVQIIDQERDCLEYLGGDFSVYGTLPEDERALVSQTAAAVCGGLQELGYRGACGVDLLLSDGNCYFMEINPRFQASTSLLNRSLRQKALPSLQEYHMDAFLHTAPSLPAPPALAEGSFFICHYRREQRGHLQWMWSALQNAEGISLCDDCLSWEDELEPNCYVFQLRHTGAISSITYQHTLRLHPNVRLSPFLLDRSPSFHNLIRLKILLLCRGLSITPEAWQAAQRIGGADWEEFGAVTMRLLKKYWITAPCREPWHDISPMELALSSDGASFTLRYYGQELFPVELLPADPAGELQTTGGHFLKDIVYLSPDRLRVYHRNGCALQSVGIGCKFCDLYGVEQDFSFAEICEALSHYWQNPRVCHFLIGGGSNLPADRCEEILALAGYLHEHSEKHIYLMSQPISDSAALRRLQDFGVTEVAFNIEIFDRELAARVMPGKAKNTTEDYCRSLRNAVEIWGNTGDVRSAVLLGFDDLEQFAQGVQMLCKIGVSPILSVFRPCPGTPLADYMPLDERSVLTYFETAEQICQSAGLRLGPACRACQNNTVALDL